MSGKSLKDGAIAASGTGALVSDQAASRLAPTGFDHTIAEALRAELEATYVGADADLKGLLNESHIEFGAACVRRAIKALKQCTCGEVAGEDPWCAQHGRDTEWAKDSPERGL